MTIHFGNIFFTVTMIWLVAEIAFTSFKRAADDAQVRQDRGTLRWINVAIYVSIPIAFWLSTLKMGRFPPDLHWIRWLGIALIVGGSIIKWSAVYQLRKQFTVDVAIVSGHSLIFSGIYSRLRHPSYLGALTSFCGLGVALGNPFSILSLMVPITLAFLNRIRVEEAVLSAAFPKEYPAYQQSSWALIPFIY